MKKLILFVLLPIIMNAQTTNVGSRLLGNAPTNNDYFWIGLQGTNYQEPKSLGIGVAPQSNNSSLVSSLHFVTDGSYRMTVASDGNVGIGIRNPQYKFHVNGGNIKAVNFDQHSGISIGAAATERPQVGFHVSDNSKRFKIELNSVNQLNERLGFFTINGGAWPETEVFSVIKNGNIGINTINPQSQLEIKTSGGAADGQGLRLTNIASNRSWELKSGSPSINNNFFTIKDILANSVRFTIRDDGNVGIGSINPSAKLEVYDNTVAGTSELLNKWSFDPSYWWLGLEQQHFGGSHVQWNFKQKNYNNEVDLLSFKLGNVGIGTTNPAAKLEVNGNTLIKVAGIPELTIEGTGNSSYAGGAIQLKSGVLQANDKFNQTTIIMDRGTTGTGMLQIQRRFDNEYNGQLIDYSDISGWRFHTASERTATTTNERFSIKPNGQITIGTATPYSDYKLSVAGNVIADKVKVKKSTNGVWPDFVFSPTYSLPTLTEVESFIKQNNHLPEIPSANEIDKEGQDLGEMNRLLLKKVEELTLYLIEQNKEIKTLKSKVELLEKK